MIKLGVVVQRYGREVLGGAETLARDVAERLNSSGFDVTVFTTTARDYITWKNHYESGESILKGVIVKRFKVEKERNINDFNKYSDIFFRKDLNNRDEKEWIIKQGPYTPDLIEALQKEQDKFDLFLFFTYLYFPTVEGINVINKPVVLFPTAHDEPPIYLNAMKRVFRIPDAICFLTGAEMNFVKELFNPQNVLKLIRTGVEMKEGVDENLFRKKYRLFTPYILYAGRIEKGKGLELVFDAFEQIRKKRLVDLILIGNKLMDIPGIDRLKYLGFVSEEEKLSAFKGAVFSIQPSPLESLSITTLESFSQKTPVVVNKKSDVLFEHTRYSQGGVTYENVEEFIQNFYLIYDNRKLRKKMGLNGYKYVKTHYAWETVIESIKDVLIRLKGDSAG